MIFIIDSLGRTMIEWGRKSAFTVDTERARERTVEEMATVSIKCPNCGGALELDDSKEFGFCIFCGTQVHIQDEKTRVEVSGSVKLDESDKYGNYLTLAARAFEVKNMSEAYTYYTKALEIRQNDYLPTFRKALCAGYLSDDLGLRIEEVVSGVSLAYDLAADQNVQKGMSEELVTFALAGKLQTPSAFYSSDECARYVQAVYNRISLLNRLYLFLDKDNAESVSKYIEVTMHCCDRLNMKTMRFAAGTTIKNGKSQALYGTYPIPQNVAADVAAVRARMAEEFNRYIRPKIEMVKSEIAELNQQTKALPPVLQICHYLCNWIVFLVGLVLAPYVVGIVIWVAQIAALVVFAVMDKEKVATSLYKQLKEKKKELAKLNKMLKK